MNTPFRAPRSFCLVSAIALLIACDNSLPDRAGSIDSGVGATSDQGGATSNQGGATSDQGGVTSDQGGATSDQGGATSDQGGATVNQGGTTSTSGTLAKFVGNVTTNDSADIGGLKFSTYWDQLTPENAGKWGSVQATASSAFNWTTLDAIYDYTQKNNIIFKEHVFIWGSQQPGGTITVSHVKNWMKTFCARYPNTKLIDVVNEPPPHTTPTYVNNIGGGTDTSWQWIINAFTWAREACPNAILILNDYNNIEYTSDATNFVNIANKVKAAGAPIDAPRGAGSRFGWRDR